MQDCGIAAYFARSQGDWRLAALAEAMPISREALASGFSVQKNPNASVFRLMHEHLNGVPPPRKRYIHDDGMVTEYA